MHPKAFLFGCFLGFSLTSCAGHSNTTELPPREPQLFAPGSHSYIANRLFPVRTTPRLSGTVVEQIEKGTALNAVILFHDDAWSYVSMDNGIEGYIFGMPLSPRK